MLVMSAAQIYGRKVDYLEEIILHMDQDQKGRDEGAEDDRPKEDKPTGGRKRAARFQPQSLSDCFGDLEFSVVDGKKVPIESLVTSVDRVAIDQRNKFQQMQELCNELRSMPSKQRKQEILNRLRDEASCYQILRLCRQNCKSFFLSAYRSTINVDHQTSQRPIPLAH